MTPPPLFEPEMVPADDPRKPRTAVVLAIVLAAALAASYLAAFAGTSALIAADLLPPFPRGQDPRPRWMMLLFSGLLTVFVFGSITIRWLSRRQLSSIDAMNEEEG